MTVGFSASMASRRARPAASSRRLMITSVAPARNVAM